MRFSVQLPTDKVDSPEEFLTQEAIAEMARCAEAAGFEACFVTDHPIPDDRWLASGGHHSLDPFVALSFAAAATTTLRLQTHVLILAYRNPFLAAKAAASLDHISGGRLILGVAAGYLEGEFRALGVDLEERNELTDESIRILKRAWSEDGILAEGRHWKALGNSMRPRPLQQPHPPIWVGGNSKRAIRRAVELGEGWLPFPAPRRLAGRVRTAPLENLDDLAARIAYANEHAAGTGRREPLDICFQPFGLDMFSGKLPDPDTFLIELSTLHRLGVTWVPLTLAAETRSEFCDRVTEFGAHILSRAQLG